MHRKVGFESSNGQHTLQNMSHKKLRKLILSNAKSEKIPRRREGQQNDTFLLAAKQNKDMDEIKLR